MREIEFRGKGKKTDEWIEGQRCTNGQEFWIVYDEDFCESTSCREDILMAWRFEEVIPETVGQYTGLKDKHGVKIYEGDILIANTTSQRLVKWLVDSWVIVYKEGGFRELSLDIEKSEVVGNIHDNPKLFKEANND